MVQVATADGIDIARHAALFGDTAEELASGIEAFVLDGVNAGQAALIASAGAILGELRSRLENAGRQISWIDLTGRGGRPGQFTSAVLAFARRHRGQSVRCVQEPAWHARPAGELSEALRHETLINLALASSSVNVLCAFPSGLAADVRQGAQRTHPAVVRDGRWQASGHFAPRREPDEPLLPPPASATRLAYRDTLHAVRRFVASRAGQLGLAPERVTDVVLAVSELAANTLAHTSGPGYLTIWAEPGEVICQVEDRGHITDSLAGLRPPAPGSPGGQGLWVVYQLADLTEVRTSPAGTTVRLHMRLRT